MVVAGPGWRFDLLVKDFRLPALFAVSVAADAKVRAKFM